MVYKIDSVKLEGIRGINKPVDVKFNEGLTVIHGPNGSGKSSILQAIEWCITGSIPYMKGGDFTKEDAIVNAFTRNKRARVELSVKGPQNITITRTKSRTSSTTSGRQNLILDADKSYQDDQAKAYMEKNLSLDIDEVSRSKFLHQETIRDALTYKPTERSAVIEKLLGTYDIKEFSKALDQRKLFNAEIKAIEETMETLQRERIQFILNLRRNLEKTKQDLLKKGYEESQLNLTYTIKEIGEMRKKLDTIAETYNHTLLHPDISTAVSSIVNANRRITEDITTLDRKRMKEKEDLQAKKLTLEGLSGTYRTALEHFKQYETLDVSDLERQRTELSIEITKLKTSLEEQQRTLTQLPSRMATYQTAKTNFDAEQATLEAILTEYGEEALIQEKMNRLGSSIEETEKELQKYSGQQRIVNLAVELIQSAKPSQCPVCSQPIDASTLVSDLRSKVSKDIAYKIAELTASRKKADSERETLSQTLVKLDRARKTVVGLEVSLQSAKKNLEALVGGVEEYTNLNALQEGFVQAASDLQGRLTETSAQHGAIDEKIRQYNYLNQEISSTRKKLQAVAGTNAEGETLLEAASAQTQSHETEMRKLDETKEIDAVSRRTIDLSEILGYIKDEESTEKAEKELPALTQQSDALKAKKASLTLLGGALNSISGIVTQYQKEASIQQIRNLEDTMNQYFSAILGHPYYERIKIDVEKEDPLQFSFRAASDREETYIPTRFSTAQLNVAALSIFMSNSKLMAGELPLLTLDDPTQNMDSEHKEAFARLVSNLVNEFQVIVATEDDETRDYLKRNCPDATYYEITEWGIDSLNITT